MSTEVYTKVIIALCKFVERASAENANSYEVEALPKVIDAVVELLKFRMYDDNYYAIENLKKELEVCKNELNTYKKSAEE